MNSATKLALGPGPRGLRRGRASFAARSEAEPRNERWWRFVFALVVSISALSPAFAQRGLKDIPDPDPKAEQATFELGAGLEVNLFAAEPMVVKPIQMNWDARGRLWVVGSQMYPQIKPGEKPSDKVYVLEDTDGDGRADKSTVFADGLLIPTAVIPGDGGAYVANSTELLHLSDTDADGKADKTRVVLSGFGTEDTHHILHTFRWGPDGCLYFNQSIYIHSHIETPHGVRRLRGGGTWRFRPDGLELEVYTRGMVNGWGHAFDRWGQSFMTDGAYGEGINYAFPGAAYYTAVDVQRTLRGLNPGQPKHCGLEILSGRHLPPEMNGDLVTNDFRGNRINRFALTESGSGYVSRQQDDILRSRSVAFRPVDLKMGPDGALYVADWYNPIIQHGEVDFRDPRRDHAHGRIWRITAKGRPLVKPPKLEGAPVEQLLAALKEPEDWTRNQARRQLQEHGGKAVLPALAKWLGQLDTTAPGADHHRLEGMWVAQSLRMPSEALAESLLASEEYQARAAAVRIVADWEGDRKSVRSWVNAAATDPHAQVRLEAVHALRRRGGPEAAKSALGVLDRPMDEFLDYALWLTVRETAPQWLPRVKQDVAYFGERPQPLLYALKAVNDPAAIDVVEKLFRSGRVQQADVPPVLEMLAAQGRPEHLQLVFEEALAGRHAAAGLAALEQAARANRARRPAGELARIGKLLEGSDREISATAARLAGLWQIETLRQALVERAARYSPPIRTGAVEGLGFLSGDKSRQTLLRFCRPPNETGLRLEAVTVLASLDVQSAAAEAVSLLREVPRGLNAAAVYAAFLGRQGGPEALAKALAGKNLPGEVAATGIRQLSSAGRKLPELEAALRTAGGLDPVAKALSPAELKQFIADVQTKGAARRGERVYRQEALGCVKCHAIGGAGGIVGPDMISLGASAQVDYLIESLLEPSKKIKENYHTVAVQTTDGRTVAGVVVQKTETHLLLRDQNDALLKIAVADIEQQANSPLSLMPEDTVKSLRRDELVDLVRFLSELGKTGGLVVPRTPTVRRWQALRQTPAVNDFVRHNGVASAAGDDPALVWAPAYSLVEGDLPLEELPWQGGVDGHNYQYLRFEIKVTAAGRVGLRFNDPTGLRLWGRSSDGKPAKPSLVKLAAKPGEPTAVDVAAGVHVFTLASESEKRKMKPLRIELVELPGSAGKAELVLGK